MKVIQSTTEISCYFVVWKFCVSQKLSSYKEALCLLFIFACLTLFFHILCLVAMNGEKSSWIHTLCVVFNIYIVDNIVSATCNSLRPSILINAYVHKEKTHKNLSIIFFFFLDIHVRALEKPMFWNFLDNSSKLHWLTHT